MTGGTTLSRDLDVAAAFPPQPLREYAMLADGERAALIGPRGNVGFMCLPRWHDDAVFSSLLGGHGAYAVSPAEQDFVWSGRYEEGTLIWVSRWVLGPRILECRDALAYPGDHDRAVLLRRVRAVRGDSRLHVLLDCRAGFGAEAMTIHPEAGMADGRWRGRTGALHLRWAGAPAARATTSDAGIELVLTVEEGSTQDLVLEISTKPLSDPLLDPERLWARTQRAWRDVVAPQSAALTPRDATHALTVLHGLNSSTGAMVAAATTSLPERAEKGRDYDYRYAWIRDQCFAGHAAAAAGDRALLGSAASFIADRLLTDGARLRPAYTVDGEPIPPSTPLTLRGYPGAPDVGTGNGAGEQFQLDAFGEALLLFAEADSRDALDTNGRRGAEIAARAIAARHREPDAGIWELEPARWTHSKLICAAGLRAYADRLRSRAPEWRSLADHLIDEADRTGRHPTGRWQRAPDDPRVDAALLLSSIRGAVPASDPRTVATWRAVVADLTDDCYVYRFRHDDSALGDTEGAFLVCGFHLALSCHQQGDIVGAMRLFERNRAAAGPPALLTEEYDVGYRQLRGNLPQAFVHAALLEAAHTLASPAEGAHP